MSDIFESCFPINKLKNFRITIRLIKFNLKLMTSMDSFKINILHNFELIYIRISSECGNYYWNGCDCNGSTIVITKLFYIKRIHIIAGFGNIILKVFVIKVYLASLILLLFILIILII